MARALYSDRPILLLDDPLSAIDACVGSHVFHKAIREFSKGKTILFVTHQLQVRGSSANVTRVPLKVTRCWKPVEDNDHFSGTPEDADVSLYVSF